VPHTIRLHRVPRAKPERVYRAFLDGDADAKAIIMCYVNNTCSVAAPEINPASAASAITLLIGSLVLLRRRKSKE